VNRRLAITPAAAIGMAVLLLTASFALALYNERLGRDEDVQRTRVQAEILAASVAAPLAFDDRATTQEYLNALRANPAVEAAGAYDTHGALAVGFRRAGPPAPPTVAQGPPAFSEGRLTVTAPVVQGTTRLGSVYLRVTTETLLRRAVRYLGIGVVVVMASLLVAVLGAAHAQLREAHRKLQQETAEREKAEEALRQAQKMEALGQLTGGVAHDFNNLLMVASSGLDLMERTSDPVRMDRLRQGIRQAIDRGANLTQQLLAFARKAPLKTEVVDLAEQLGLMHDVLDRSLREDIAVRVEAQDGLWPVEVDPAQFEVALLNIALNARDAMPNGGTITIRLTNQPGGVAGDRVLVAIADTGVGMAPDMLSRVFEPFFTTKGVGKGTGLGLSQVYGFARASGGEVRAESEEGRGSTIALLLPRSDKAPPVRSEAAAPAPVADTDAGRRRVLLVEDDDRVAELVGDMLSELGFEATRAPTAANALEVLRVERGFDIVFSDMVMPGEMNGLDLARRIARDQPELPVVLTTGFSASAAAVAAEGMRLLVKPYRIEALASELEAALGERRAVG
jgi:signal transduction histidine kinase/CheY-like chemotaxis protein